MNPYPSHFFLNFINELFYFVISGSNEPLICKFADNPHARKRGPQSRGLWPRMMPPVSAASFESPSYIIRLLMEAISNRQYMYTTMY